MNFSDEKKKQISAFNKLFHNWTAVLLNPIPIHTYLAQIERSLKGSWCRFVLKTISECLLCCVLLILSYATVYLFRRALWNHLGSYFDIGIRDCEISIFLKADRIVIEYWSETLFLCDSEYCLFIRISRILNILI